MTARAYWELNCDGDCGNAYPAPADAVGSEWAIRRAAGQDGWQLRPRSGKGSRSAPDLCPPCQASGATR